MIRARRGVALGLGVLLAVVAGCTGEEDGLPLAGKSPSRLASQAPTSMNGGVSTEASPTPAATGSLAPAPTPTPEAFKLASFPVKLPGALSADGSGNFWIASTDYSGATPVSHLYKVSAAGAILASPSIGFLPRALVADGANLYITDGKKLGKFDAAGAPVGSAVTFNAEAGGAAIALDGGTGRLWLVGGGKVHAYSTGLAPQSSYNFRASTGAPPAGLALDGAGNAWVVGGSWAAKINAGAAADTFAVRKDFNLWASALEAVLATGSGVWIAQPGVYVTKLGPDGAEAGSYLAGTGAERLVLDGAGKLLAARGTSLSKLDPDNGETLATYTVSAGINGLLFTGGNAWYTSTGANALTKATF